MKRIIKQLLATTVLLSSIHAAAQVDSGVKITESQKGGEMLDSIKKVEYPYTFPLLGKKAASKGFILPYPAGVMVNAFIGSQDVTISDLNIGIFDAAGNTIIPETSLDEIVGFGEVRAAVSNINMRGDIWILPFLDVYGIFGKAWVQTHVGINSIIQQPVDINTTARFDGYVYGFGTMATGGIHSSFASLDFNMVWSHFDQMVNNNKATNLSLRTGYVVHLSKPERNIAFWTGAGRTFLNNKTVGNILLAEIAPDMGQNYKNSDWYNDLSPQMQEIADRVVENFVNKNKGDVIHYSLDKRPTKNWSMILGVQYQLDRRWQFRTEVNMFGGRRSGLISANYRFGIKTR